MARDPTFPRPVHVFAGNRWSAHELAVWMDAQLAARAERRR
jgi:predicted DNA-binding transcriptional regulator AlpA